VLDQIGDFFNNALVNPLTVALTFLYGVLGDVGIPSWGLTIVVFTIIVKTVTLPLTITSLRSSKKMQRLQPELSEVRKKYPKDKMRLQQETMALYSRHGVNPAAGCLPMLVQMPIWFALYRALWNLADPLAHTYDESFAEPFLWVSSLAKNEGIPFALAILSAITGYVMMRMTMVKSVDPQQKMTQQIMQFMPLMYLIFAVQEIITAGLVVYWVTTNVITIFQQLFLTGWGSLLPVHVQKRTGYFEKGLIGIQIDKEAKLREAREAAAAEIVETETQATPVEVPQATRDGRKPKRRSTVASNRAPPQRSRTAGTSGRRRKRRRKNASRS
jgi:YidC/Oxa1 family membrane protein insertase